MNAKQQIQSDRFWQFHKQYIWSKLLSCHASLVVLDNAFQSGGGRGRDTKNIPILKVSDAQQESANDKAEVFTIIFSQMCPVDDPSWLSPEIPTLPSFHKVQ